MINREKSESLLIEEPREVDIVAIERELAQLWKSAADPLEGETASPVVRACSYNLVVVTEHPEAVERLGAFVGDVSVEHPSRIFLVLADRSSATPSLSSWISARCSLPVPGGKQVCCEQINLTVRGTDTNKIPSVVTSLLVPDVPTVVLWKANVDHRDMILRSLAEIADRVVIDSSEERRPNVSLISWSKLIAAHTQRTSFGDLAWTHIAGWRSLVAEVFDPIGLREELSKIENVVIEYSTNLSPYHSGLGQSLLLLGWFSGCLKWTPVYGLKSTNVGEYTSKFRCEEQAINITVRQYQSAPLSGGITSIFIRTASKMEIQLQISLEPGYVEIHVRQNGQIVSQRVAFLGDLSESALLARELDLLYRDSLYEGSLGVLVGLLMGEG